MVVGQPTDAFIIRMGTPPYEPFDEDLLKALLPHYHVSFCRICKLFSFYFGESIRVSLSSGNTSWHDRLPGIGHV